MLKKIGLPIMLILLAAAAGYYIIQEKIVKKAAEEAALQERGQWQQKTEELEEKIALLEKEVAETVPGVAEEKWAEVLGQAGAEDNGSEAAAEDSETRIKNFFAYIDEKGYLPSQGIQMNAADYFRMLVDRLEKARPVVSGETSDLYKLLKNLTFFFRVLGKPDVQVIKAVLEGENDIIEPTLQLFCDWIDPWRRRNEHAPLIVTPELLYEYSSFFLNTIAGQSYLYRRDSKTRCLVTYHCIMILEKANEQDLNKYGIDIRPLVAALINDIESHKQLVRRIAYLNRLYAIKKKYES